MRVIGTVGLPGSGKGVFATVAEELDVRVVTMGDVVREACRERGLDPDEHHGAVARDLRAEEGPGAIAERTLPEVESALAADDVETVLIDGIRSDVEVEHFEEAFGEDFTLVGIEAPYEVREQRIDSRGRGDANRESLRERDDRELGFGMGAALDRADVTVENTGTLEEFRDRVREILERERELERGGSPENGGRGGSGRDSER